MQALSSPLVSIVTPAYNEEEHIATCIESVLAQTYPNWDYTIIDNCSTDKTLAIAQKYAAGNPRIRIISNQKTIPAIANFNFAIRETAGASKYCKMIFADDWMFPECVERMVALMEKHPSVGITGAYGLQNSRVAWGGLPYPSSCVSGHEMGRQRLLGGRYMFGSQSSVLFRSDLLRDHDPLFNESNVHADSEACLRLLKSCDFGFVHQVLTFSRDGRPDSMLRASQEHNTAAPAFLYEILVYGPHYLTENEYEMSIARTISNYYDFLGASVLQGRDQKFWEFHRQKLKELGVELRYTKLARAVIRRYVRGFRTARNTNFWGVVPAE